MRRLAVIEEILNIEPIAGADRIEVATIKGWKAVVGKGQHTIGEKVVYVETDAILPHAPWSSFLWKKGDEGKTQIRLRICKFKHQISQGLVLPLSVLDGKKFPTDKRDNPVYPFRVGMEVTGMLGISKWDPPIPACLAGVVKGQFPCWIPKTDETRIQAAPGVLKEIAGKPVYIATKCDGSSMTVYYNRGEYGVCSRNLEFKEEDTSTFSEVARKYDLKNKLAALGRNIAIQAECVGEGIQRNRMGMKGHDMLVFNVYSIDEGKYLNMADAFALVKSIGLPTVPVDSILDADANWAVEQLLKVAEGVYPGTDSPREGIVVRPLIECYSAELKGRLSFKVINPLYLLANADA